MAHVERLFRRAESLGITLTTPRCLVMEAVVTIGGPFSAGQLLEVIQERSPDVGRATVFRTLQLLSDAKLLERIRLEDGQDVYVVGHDSGHHHHLICNSCGDILEIEECHVSELARAQAAKRGFVVQDHTFEIYGVCAHCQE